MVIIKNLGVFQIVNSFKSRYKNRDNITLCTKIFYFFLNYAIHNKYTQKYKNEEKIQIIFYFRLHNNYNKYTHTINKYTVSELNIPIII